MSVIAELTIPADALPGGEILSETASIRLEVERIIPSNERALPFFWVFGENVDRFVSELENEPELADLTVLDRTDYGVLVRATWTPDSDVIHAIRELEATILEAIGSADNWWFRIRASDCEKIRSFTEAFEKQNIPVDLKRIKELDKLVEGPHPALTPEQEKLLLTAYDAGYFDQPRRVTQEDLGEEFDITSRAVSDRLRRGTRNLIASSLVSARPSIRH